MDQRIEARQSVANADASGAESQIRRAAVGAQEGFPVRKLAAAEDSDPLSGSSRCRARALEAFPDRLSEVLPILRRLMKDPSPQVRECAILEIESFVKRGSPEVPTLVTELIAALDDPKPPVRLEACRALCVYRVLQAQSQRVVPAMVRLIREENGTYRLQALMYLMMIKTIPKDLEPILRTMLTSDIAVERIDARKALILLGIADQERDAMIKSMLESPHLNERLAAAQLLIELGKPEMAIPALNDLVASGDGATSAHARRVRDLEERRGASTDSSTMMQIKRRRGHPGFRGFVQSRRPDSQCQKNPAGRESDRKCATS